MIVQTFRSGYLYYHNSNLNVKDSTDKQSALIATGYNFYVGLFTHSSYFIIYIAYFSSKTDAKRLDLFTPIISYYSD